MTSPRWMLAVFAATTLSICNVGARVPCAGPVETALTVQLQDDGITAWPFQQEPKVGDDAESVVVIAGEVNAATERVMASGHFAIDVDGLSERDATPRATGAFAVEYAVDDAGVRGQVAFQDFSDNGGEALDALYLFDQVHGGEGEIELGWTTKGDDTSSELAWIVRSRWSEIGNGRSDSLVTGGGRGGERRHRFGVLGKQLCSGLYAELLARCA